MAIHRRVVLAALGVTLWGVAYGWPLWAIGRRSVDGVAGRTGLSWDTFRDVLTDGRVGRLALITLGQTLVSTLVVVALGVPMGWVFGRLRFPGRRFAAAVVMTPFVLPTLTVAGAMLALTGGLPRSAGARLALIVAAHVCFNLGLMVRSTAAAVSGTPSGMEDAARTLGRRPPAAIAGTTLAALRPTIAGTAVVVALFCLTSFGVIVALGGASVGTIEVEVWYSSTRALDLARAAVLAGLQLVVVLTLVARYRRTRPVLMGRAVAPLRRATTRAERLAVGATGAVVALVSATPMVAIVIRSFRDPDGWTVDHYRALAAGDAARAVGHSLAAASVATIVALVIAVPTVTAAARSDRLGRFLERLMLVPLAVSAATLGLGYLLAFGGPALDLRGTWIVVPLVQGAAAAPVAARVLLEAVRSLDPAPADAASTLGAGPIRRLVSVTWPAVRRPFVVAVGFAFAMAVGEFGATVFVSRQDRPTLAVLIGRLLGRPGSANLGQALALSCVLGAVAAVSVALADRGEHQGPTF